jgi:hypothetical protein
MLDHTPPQSGRLLPHEQPTKNRKPSKGTAAAPAVPTHHTHLRACGWLMKTRRGLGLAMKRRQEAAGKSGNTKGGPLRPPKQTFTRIPRDSGSVCDE